MARPAATTAPLPGYYTPAYAAPVGPHAPVARGVAPTVRSSPSDAAVLKHRQASEAATLKQQRDDLDAFTANVLVRDAWRYDRAAYLPTPSDAARP